MNESVNLSESLALRPRGLVIAAILMIVFGLAEVITGFTHDFFGVSTTQSTLSTIIGAGLGVFYIVSGVLILTLKKEAAALAIALLAADIVGRILMVVTGLFPIDSPKQTFSIIAGTVIAALFAVYIGLRWKAFK